MSVIVYESDREAMIGTEIGTFFFIWFTVISLFIATNWIFTLPLCLLSFIWLHLFDYELRMKTSKMIHRAENHSTHPMTITDIVDMFGMSRYWLYHVPRVEEVQYILWSPTLNFIFKFLKGERNGR